MRSNPSSSRLNRPHHKSSAAKIDRGRPTARVRTASQSEHSDREVKDALRQARRLLFGEC